MGLTLASSPLQARVTTEFAGGDFEVTGFVSSEVRYRAESALQMNQWVNKAQIEMELGYEEKFGFDELSFVTVIRPEFDAAYWNGRDMTDGRVGRKANRPSYMGIPLNFANDPIDYAGFDVLFGSDGSGPLLSTGGLSKNVSQGFWAAERLEQFEVIAHHTNFPVVSPISDHDLDCARCLGLDNSYRRVAFNRTDSNEALYPIRELYVDAVVDSWWFRVGKQQIVWGKTDFFRIQDIINPVDFGPHFFFESFEDIRIPQWMASVQYKGDTLGPLEDTAIQLIWNFDQFRPVGLGSPTGAWAHPFAKQNAAFAGFNTYFSPEPCVSETTQLASGAPASTVCVPGDGRLPSGFGIPLALGKDNRPEWKLKNNEFGARFEFRIGGARFSLSHYYGWTDAPVSRFDTINVDLAKVPALFPMHNDDLVIGLTDGAFVGGPAGSPILNPVAVMDPGEAIAAAANAGDADAIAAIAADNARLFYQTGKVLGGFNSSVYEQVHTTGLSFDYFDDRSGIVLRVESTITLDEPVNNTRKANWVDHSDVVRYSIGLDRPTFIRFLNPDQTFFLSTQLFDTWYLDHEGDEHDGYFVDDHNFIATFLATTSYLRNQLTPTTFLVWEVASDSWVWGSSVQYLISNHFSVTAGANLIWGGKKDMDHDVGPFTSFTLDGNYEQEAVFGIGKQGIGAFRENNEVYLRLKYQF